VHLLKGLCLRDLREWAAARAALERAVRLAPGMTAPREVLADVHAQVGDTGRALDQLEALAALDPTNAHRFVALGLAHARARRYDAAVLTLTRAVERFPQAPEIYGALGHVWLEAAEARGDEALLHHALSALNTAAGYADATSEVFTDLGRAYRLTGDLGAAEHAWVRATTRVPVEPNAYLQLASVVRRDRPEAARDALERYAALVKGRRPLSNVATEIASVSLRLGEPDVALAWIDRAREEAGETPLLASLRRRALAR
jgi:tetratricopeptide (TPR) repeat protein